MTSCLPMRRGRAVRDSSPSLCNGKANERSQDRTTILDQCRNEQFTNKRAHIARQRSTVTDIKLLDHRPDCQHEYSSCNGSLSLHRNERKVGDVNGYGNLQAYEITIPLSSNEGPTSLEYPDNRRASQIKSPVYPSQRPDQRVRDKPLNFGTPKLRHTLSLNSERKAQNNSCGGSKSEHMTSQRRYPVVVTSQSQPILPYCSSVTSSNKTKASVIPSHIQSIESCPKKISSRCKQNTSYNTPGTSSHVFLQREVMASSTRRSKPADMTAKPVDIGVSRAQDITSNTPSLMVYGNNHGYRSLPNPKKEAGKNRNTQRAQRMLKQR